MVPNSSQRILSLQSQPELEAQAFECVLATALRGVVAELFFTEAGLLIGYINAGQTGNIEDIVASSCERSLKPHSLRYGGHALTQSDWGRPPSVTLDLEFSHPTLTIYFKLVFDATSVGVDIDSINFKVPTSSHDERLELVRTALEESRVPA